MSEQQNTQRPVAVTTAVPADAENYLRQKFGAARAHPEWRALEAAFYAGMKLQADRNTAPPVPRDVLMAFGADVLKECTVTCDVFGDVSTVDLAAIADRYASQVQTDPVTKQNTSESQPEGSDLDGLDLSHIPSDQLDALAKIYRISGIPLIHTGELEDKTMSAEEVFSMNVKWLEDVLSDVTNINFPIHGKKNE